MNTMDYLPSEIWEHVYKFHNPIKYHFKHNIKIDIWRESWLRWYRNNNEFNGFHDNAFRLTMRYLFAIWYVEENDNLTIPIIKNDWFIDNFFPNQITFTIYPTNEEGCLSVSVMRNTKELFNGWVMDNREYDLYNDKYNEEVENTIGVFSDRDLGLHLIQFTY